MGTYIHFTDEQKLRANNVDLVDFLERQGEKLIRSGPEKRLASDHSITVRGNEWYDHATESGGYAIDFVRQFYSLTFPEAVTMLLGGEQGKVYEPAEKKKQEQKKPFALPDANSDMRRVYGYLVKTRLLDREVVSYFAKQKLIYESCEKSKDGTKEYHNAVFVGLDENGVARHAHKRGLYTEGTGFKGNVDSCNPAYSFHHIGNSNRLYVFEAPIDLLSFISLYPKDWQSQSYVALCGVSEHAMLKALELNPQLSHVVLCLDHDEAGLEAGEKYYDLLSHKGVQCGRILPKFKDWNEVVKAAHGVPALPAEEHPQHRLRDEICGELSAVKSAEPLSANRLSAMLQNVRTHLHGGRFSDAEDCLKEMLSGAVASAANEYRQMNHCRNLSTVQSRLRYGFRTYENRGRFKARLDTLELAIMSLRGYERIPSPAEKEKLAESYEAVAAHCLKAVILMEQDQQKQEQKQTPAMAMA